MTKHEIFPFTVHQVCFPYNTKILLHSSKSIEHKGKNELKTVTFVVSLVKVFLVLLTISIEDTID